MNRIGDKEFRQQWIAALRSGDFTQTREGYLRDDHGYCCLGVACTLLPNADWGLGLALNSVFIDSEENCGSLKNPAEIGLTEVAQEALIDLNDSQGFTFAEIADVLEAGVYDVFGVVI